MGILVVLAASTAALPQQADSRVTLGQLDDGSSVVFVQAASGGWGIEIAGSRTARFSQQRPADIEYETLAARSLHLDAITADLLGPVVDGQ